jgi:hypothetical protein
LTGLKVTAGGNREPGGGDVERTAHRPSCRSGP